MANKTESERFIAEIKKEAIEFRNADTTVYVSDGNPVDMTLPYLVVRWRRLLRPADARNLPRTLRIECNDVAVLTTIVEESTLLEWLTNDPRIMGMKLVKEFV